MAAGLEIYARIDQHINDITEQGYDQADERINIKGEEKVLTFAQTMGAEDFGAMLQKKPGCYIALGQGLPDDPNSPHNRGLHHPGFDFNDAILPDGIRYFTALAEKSMPV